MAVLMIEGFDHDATLALLHLKGWGGGTTSQGVDSTSFVTGRLSGKAIRFSITSTHISIPGDNVLYKQFPSSQTVVVGFAFMKNSSTMVDRPTWRLTSAARATEVASLRFDSTSHPYLTGFTGTLATSTTAIANNVWHYYEIKYFFNGASSTVEMYLDGVVDIASATVNAGSTNAEWMEFYLYAVGGATVYYDVDDLYVLDTTGAAPRNTFLGDTRVETIVPDGAGNSTVWTPNTGTNWAAVKELPVPDGDTTYVSSGTPGDIDTYTYGDMTIASGTVFGVQTNLYARKDDAGVRQIAPVTRQSGTDYFGATVTLTTSYVFYSEIFNQDPTAADWTISTVNADEFGVKEIA